MQIIFQSIFFDFNSCFDFDFCVCFMPVFMFLLMLMFNEDKNMHCGTKWSSK